ncbi:mitochondrial carrier protein [Aspergillus steynii IBT 23096]|uniref:Mitochondrial carrier protein n=1 Tax=Aspergillus steynii IBT 23096 TaxID=1392250 RepID=A0A2I2GCK0_9EURO|nr:mitochondrial carrier protein [Aspergillus steynii IBT 23096]PLB50609.1 mitochondrial carrier protein [Aspergillus steynii IBT 23096]
MQSVISAASSSPLVQSSGSGISPASKEIVVGAAGGVTQVLIGKSLGLCQPFDIVKVRMQNRVDGGAFHIASTLWKQEGPRSFYKGSLAPFIGVGACISIVYGSFHLASTALQTWHDQPLSTPQTYLAGGLAGLSNSLVSGPMEHIRIRLQMQSSRPEERIYAGTADCVRQILRRGGLSALYRGQTATMLREFHSYGIWFSVYGALMAMVVEDETRMRTAAAAAAAAGQPEDGEISVPPWKVAACGAVTGEVLWALNYPFDVVKSTMQADGFGAERRYRTMRHAVRHIWCVDGWRGFFRGLGPTLGRALPVSAGTFLV